MSNNSDMIRMLRLVEGQQFAGLPEQQPGDQVRGTEQAKKNGQQHPFHNRLVGEEISLEDKLSKKYQDMKDLHSKEEKEKDELEKKVAEGSLNELSVSTLSSYGKKAEKSINKKLDKAAGHSEKATKLYDKGTASAVAKSYDHEDEVHKLHKQVNKRDANMDQAAGKLKNKMSKGVAEYGPAATAALQQGQHPIQVAAADRKDQENTLNINRSAMKAQQDVANGLDPTQTAAGNGVAEGNRPFRGVDGAFNRGDDERHDLDPTDWYIVKDGEMFSASIYPKQVQQAIAQGFSRTRAEAKAKSQANSQTGSSEELEESQQESPMERPMLHRIMMRHMDLIEKYGIDLVLDSVRDIANSMNIGPDDEIGTSDVSAAMVNVMNQLNSLDQTIDEENIPAGNINASGSPTVSSGPTPVSAGGTAPVTQSSTAPAPAASTAPAAAGQQPPMTPEEQVALNKIKANAGLKTQYDRLIQQAH